MSASKIPSTNRHRWRFANLTIGRKLVAIVVLCVGFGFMAMIGVQITGTRADLHDLAFRNSLQVTRLLATSVAGGVRWQQPDAIEHSYRTFLEGTDTELVSFIALDINGQILVAHDSGDLLTLDHDAAIEDALETISRDELYTHKDSDHIVVVAPIVTGRDNTRVGTLAVAWSLKDVNDLIAANLDRQGVMAGFSLFALVVVLLALLNFTVSYPLRAVSAATIQLAQGDRSVPVPEVERGDEIGEMARALEVFKGHIAMIDHLTEEQQEHARRLSEALENERRYNALHREFVSMASHEFRTPLAIIDGAAQRIIRRAEGMSPDELLERVGKIRQAVIRMTGLIDSTLSASRMEAGHMEIAAELCNLHDILEAVCGRQQEIARGHDIVLDLHQATKLIVADPKQLDQIFTNLLSNAVKYSPEKGRIEVMAGSEGDMAVISVRDQGVGIPADEMPQLFERFFRASTSTGIPGTGIGLNLVKQLVEMHGGAIDFSSIEGDGSTFVVRLPMTAAAEGVGPTQADNDANLSETRIAAVAQR